MEVEIIKARDPFDNSVESVKVKRMRVAAYCRVSTDDDDQIKSYNSMVKYYTDLIENNKDWVFAGVYADKATTGTKVDKRESFQRLIEDCLHDKIDMVLAKSLSRFARNTLDTLKYVRMLKERNIAVYFEVEKINTMKDGEFLMTILSSVAQQEVENTSAYVKKGLKMKMKRGEMVGFQGCLGYDYDSLTKTISVNEDEAEIVRYIFERYAQGAGCTVIARELNERDWKTLRGNRWTSSGVLGIVTNEKYTGNLLQGKSFTVDPISKRRIANKGEEDQFYAKNHHEAIISEELFEKAQEIRKRRSGEQNPTTGKREKFSRQFAFSCLLECGFCGHNYSRRCWHSGTPKERVVWECARATKYGRSCCPDSKGLPEDVIEQAFVESYRMLCADNADVIDEFVGRVEKTLGQGSAKQKLKQQEKASIELTRKRRVLLEKYLAGSVSEDIYASTDEDYLRQLQELQESIDELKYYALNEEDIKQRAVKFKKLLEKNEVIEKFDRAVFESVIDKVIIGGYDENGNKDPYKITFIYKTGSENSLGQLDEKYDLKSRKRKSKKGPFDKDGNTDSSLSSNNANNIENGKSLSSDKSADACGDMLSLNESEQ